MKLSEKFKQWLDTEPRIQIREVQLEVIADDYAIEFATFIDKKYYQHEYDCNKYAESEEDFTYGKTYTIKQLLEIFKREKGL